MSSSELKSLKTLIRSGNVPAQPVSCDVKTEFAELASELILKSVGEDLEREGLERTPVRFAKALREICSGYAMTLEDAIGQGVFPAEGKGLVSVREIEYHSLCEHHMLPFYGKATVAYYPDQSILGLSKIPRILDLYSKRFQVQERLTRQIAEAIESSIQPRAVVVRITGTHLCMKMRGVAKQQSETVTEYSLGIEKLSAIELEAIRRSVS